MLWVTTTELEMTLAEAGFIEPTISGGFVWIWYDHRDMRAWGYTARFGSRLRSRKAVRARLLRALARLGDVEITWAHVDEADFYFVSDIIDHSRRAEPDEDDTWG
jgi:hypothetical protein